MVVSLPSGQYWGLGGRGSDARGRGAPSARVAQGRPVVGGSAARVTAGLQELADVEGDPDAGDAVVLDVQPVGDGEGLAVLAGCCPLPWMSSACLPRGSFALADDAEAAGGEASVIQSTVSTSLPRTCPVSLTCWAVAAWASG